MLPAGAFVSYASGMRELSSQQSKGIFRQIAEVDGAQGVKTVIENHDAWVHNDEVLEAIDAAMQMAAAARPRGPELTQRIARQRAALGSLVTRVPLRFSNAG